MRLPTLCVFLAAAAIGVSGLAPQRQVLVTYPSNTPESTINEAKEAIKTAVGAMRSIQKAIADTGP